MKQSQQEIHVGGYSDGAPSSDGPPPHPQPQPAPRRRLSWLRIVVGAVIGVCILVGIIMLLIWLIYRPQTIEVAVDRVTLSRFLLNSTTSPPVLSFNLTAGLIITNPNRRASVKYHLLRAEGIYQGQRFDRVALPMSSQGARRADAVRAVLEGSSALGGGKSPAGVGAAGNDDDDDDNTTAVYPVDLWIDGVLRYKYGALMTTSASTLSVKCPLLLQLMVPSSSVVCIVNG
ncbi:uncharacterized protein LOC104583354 [Brachypodium distachyon]|uniref:Late embryogenesis abundant protein LEA-2 subgroup domain-containing protein n=1 Tax=Brachypodium distachyon TaxID=15368 RepID=A0A0Q3JE99_BRADI|nr:uncharacterized protein LOC104583354 [Brachypodium distachyon]KQK10748.1 hypothetical protein BRADI_2g55926v3 [Brachypodium distachyon]|eukprot:XP_010233559.1 uncharacterized protein LOC104583354 [Brachypodium distachyon]